MRRLTILLVALLLAPLSPIPTARAQPAFPGGNIRLVVPFAAGGSADVLARITAAALSTTYAPHTVVIENRGGAGGHIGAEIVAHAPPDGRTWLLGNIGIHAASTIYRALPYDPARDLAPIGLLAEFPNVIAVTPALPVHTLPELVAYARAHPGELLYGSAGSGASTHLAGEAFALATNTRLTHVPYRGSAPALNDLVAGNIALMFENLPTAQPLVQTGAIRALAVTGSTRAADLPAVPTAVEAGVPGYIVTAWFAISTASGTPQPLLDRLNADLRAVLSTPDIRARFAALGATPLPGSAADARAFFDAERARWTTVIAAAHVSAE